MRIINWTAYPSGGAITVTGYDPKGMSVRVRNVCSMAGGIEPRGWFRTRQVVDAYTADGAHHVLA